MLRISMLLRLCFVVLFSLSVFSYAQEGVYLIKYDYYTTFIKEIPPSKTELFIGGGDFNVFGRLNSQIEDMQYKVNDNTYYSIEKGEDLHKEVADFDNDIYWSRVVYKGYYRIMKDDISMSWELVPNETKEILGYHCEKAKTRFRGRDYDVWFTPEIPINYGPWKFHGLPGLILKVQVKDKSGYGFEATKITNQDVDVDFYREKYQSIMKNKDKYLPRDEYVKYKYEENDRHFKAFTTSMKGAENNNYKVGGMEKDLNYNNDDE